MFGPSSLQQTSLFGCLSRGYGLDGAMPCTSSIRRLSFVGTEKDFGAIGPEIVEKKGRPGLDPKIRLLIRRISQANPLWGAPRIHGELLKLGISVSETTVAKYLVRTRKPPSQTWRTFLENHAKDIVATDFFTVPTATFRVLFVLVVLSHDRREILHSNVTESPTAEWTARQIVEAVGLDDAPKYLIRDQDRKFSAFFSRQVASVGLTEVLTAPASPWQDGVRRACDRHNQKGMSGSHDHSR